jgi:putative chitinase
MPRCKHPEYLDNINAALEEGQINTNARKAAFLAQLAHESGQLVYMEELASGEAYEGRKDLGNTHPGDGKRFKGRGPIQLTGRANYRAAGQALGLDLEADPEQVKTAEVGFRTSVWFWTKHQLNALADENTLHSFRKITKKINGGTNGQADREHYWAKAKKALMISNSEAD